MSQMDFGFRPSKRLAKNRTVGTSAGAEPPQELEPVIWVWVKIQPPGDRRFESLVPFTRLLLRVPIFDQSFQALNVHLLWP